MEKWDEYKKYWYEVCIMSERIAFASWDFIELVCSVHGKELSLEMRKQQPTYVCLEKECSFQIPAVAYEKVLTDIVERMNTNSLAVGESWRKKYQGQNYEFKVVVFTSGKKICISVRKFGG